MLAYAIYLYSHNPMYNGIVKYTNYIYKNKMNKLINKNIENKCMYNMLRVRDRNFMWLKYVKHILCNCGFNYIWESQTFIN
jgi:hypothetical protein